MKVVSLSASFEYGAFLLPSGKKLGVPGPGEKGRSTQLLSDVASGFSMAPGGAGGGEWLVALSRAGLGPLSLIPIRWELLKGSREQRSAQQSNLRL